MCVGETLMSGVQHKEGLTLNCVSVHVVEHVSKTEYPGGSGWRAAFKQGGSEFLPGLTRM